jgi:hypothetical protein
MAELRFLPHAGLRCPSRHLDSSLAHEHGDGLVDEEDDDNGERVIGDAT